MSDEFKPSEFTPSITIGRIAEDYNHPAQKINTDFEVPSHVVEGLGGTPQVEETPPGLEAGIPVPAEDEPEAEPTYQENFISDEPPEDLIEIPMTTSMKQEDHEIVEEAIEFDETPEVSVETAVEEPIAETIVETKPVNEEMVEDNLAPDEQQAPVDPYIPPKHNFKVRWEPKFKDKSENKNRNIFNELPIMPSNSEEFNYYAQLSPDDLEYKTDKDKVWLAYLKEASGLFHDYQSFEKTMSRTGSNWDQVVESEIGLLGLSRPNFGKSTDNTLSGEKALLKFSSIMNLGQLMSVPLWHSGIWIKLKAPSDAALLALENRIAEEKVMLGRQTNGFIFSNSSAYIYDYLLNLIFGCVYDTTYGKQSPEDLRKIIKITDIPTIVWGFLCTIYPNGYPLAQPCINSIGKCNHIEQEMVMISKLMWVDKSSLTSGQIKHMTKRDAKMDDDSIHKYQEELSIAGDKLTNINEKLSIVLSVPTIQEYIDSGYKWVEGIERMVAQSFAASKQGDERNDYILNMSKTMALRQYSQWIKEVQFMDDPTDPDSTNFVKDRDTLEEFMDTISKDPDLTNKILEKVIEFIDGSTMSVFGIPRYLCPVCNTDQGKNLADDRYIIPLDVVRIFFILLSQRLLRVTLSMSE